MTIAERISACIAALAGPGISEIHHCQERQRGSHVALFLDMFVAAHMLQRAAAETRDAGIAGLQLVFIVDAQNELVGRQIDPIKHRAEEREIREAYGIDDDDMERMKLIHDQRNKPQ